MNENERTSLNNSFEPAAVWQGRGMRVTPYDERKHFRALVDRNMAAEREKTRIIYNCLVPSREAMKEAIDAAFEEIVYTEGADEYALEDELIAQYQIYDIYPRHLYDPDRADLSGSDEETDGPAIITPPAAAGLGFPDDELTFDDLFEQSPILTSDELTTPIIYDDEDEEEEADDEAEPEEITAESIAELFIRRFFELVQKTALAVRSFFEALGDFLRKHVISPEFDPETGEDLTISCYEYLQDADFLEKREKEPFPDQHTPLKEPGV